MSNAFRPEELVKVQGKQYPVVGGRLRLAHEENEHLKIETVILFYSEAYVIVQARITTNKGSFSGLGNASVKRDRVLSHAILELAETRSIARALRFAGYGVEYTGYEEVSEIRNQLVKEENPATKTQLKSLFQTAKKIEMTNEDLRMLILDKTGKNYSKDLSNKEAEEIMDILNQKLLNSGENEVLQ